jgi:hypothetical protein
MFGGCIHGGIWTTRSGSGLNLLTTLVIRSTRGEGGMIVGVGKGVLVGISVMVGVDDGVEVGQPMPVVRSHVGVDVGVVVRTRVGRGLGVFVGRLTGGQVGPPAGSPH